MLLKKPVDINKYLETVTQVKDDIIDAVLEAIGSGVTLNYNVIASKKYVRYSILFAHIPFKDAYMNIFDKDPNEDPIYTLVTGSVYYDRENILLRTLEDNTTIQFHLTLDNSIQRFYVHFEADNTVSIEYSVNGSTWYPVTLDSIMLHPTTFNELYIRVTVPTAGTNLQGILIAYNFYIPTLTNTRLFEIYSPDSTIPKGSIITLPNDASYTPDGKSLEVYLNRTRLIPGIDYEEVNNKQIRILSVDIQPEDVLIFQQQFGYVDFSLENTLRLDTEHDENGYHVFRDRTTGQLYRLYVDDGTINLEPI